MEQALKFVSALRRFSFFEEYMISTTIKNWISLGLSANVKTFEPLQPICRKGEIAKDVYFNLQGNVKVVIQEKKKYTRAIVDKLSVGVIKPGHGFGELGVLYGKVR